MTRIFCGSEQPPQQGHQRGRMHETGSKQPGARQSRTGPVHSPMYPTYSPTPFKEAGRVVLCQDWVNCSKREGKSSHSSRARGKNYTSETQRRGTFLNQKSLYLPRGASLLHLAPLSCLGTSSGREKKLGPNRGAFCPFYAFTRKGRLVCRGRLTSE